MIVHIFILGLKKNVFVNSPESGGLQIENLKSNHKQPQQKLHFRNDLQHVTRVSCFKIKSLFKKVIS